MLNVSFIGFLCLRSSFSCFESPIGGGGKWGIVKEVNNNRQSGNTSGSFYEEKAIFYYCSVIEKSNGDYG